MNNYVDPVVIMEARRDRKFVLCIVGNRHTNIKMLRTVLPRAIEKFKEMHCVEIGVIIQRGAEGNVDDEALSYAIKNQIRCFDCRALYKYFGKKLAGPIRNKIMATDSDGLIAFWDFKCKAVGDAIKKFRRKGKPVMVLSLLSRASSDQNSEDSY